MEQDQEWVPPAATDGGESDGREDEGVDEGQDSVLADPDVRDDVMDTIARKADHPYHLRSLHKVESFSGPQAPAAELFPPVVPTARPQTTGQWGKKRH